MKIPIQVHPSRQKSPETWSYHHPLSAYINWLIECGFTLKGLEEWVSDKTSTGAQSRRENRARSEFPLFMALYAVKIDDHAHIGQ